MLAEVAVIVLTPSLGFSCSFTQASDGCLVVDLIWLAGSLCFWFFCCFLRLLSYLGSCLLLHCCLHVQLNCCCSILPDAYAGFFCFFRCIE